MMRVNIGVVLPALLTGEIILFADGLLPISIGLATAPAIFISDRLRLIGLDHASIGALARTIFPRTLVCVDLAWLKQKFSTAESAITAQLVLTGNRGARNRTVLTSARMLSESARWKFERFTADSTGAV